MPPTLSSLLLHTNQPPTMSSCHTVYLTTSNVSYHSNNKAPALNLFRSFWFELFIRFSSPFLVLFLIWDRISWIFEGSVGWLEDVNYIAGTFSHLIRFRNGMLLTQFPLLFACEKQKEILWFFFWGSVWESRFGIGIVLFVIMIVWDHLCVNCSSVELKRDF